MTLLMDEWIKDIVRAVHGDDDFLTMDDTEPIDLEVDPVARLTEPEQQESLVPQSIAPPSPTPDVVDVMTSTPKEKQRGQETFQQSTPGSSASFQAAQQATMLDKPSTGQFVRRMLAKEGLPYEWGSTGQPDPESGRKAFDCSGIIYRIMQNFGFSNFPRVSGNIIEHATPISVKKAINTRGAVLWHEGHIAVSLGNGKTIEAMGEDYGVVIGNAKGRFTKGGLLPELKLGKALQEAGKSKVSVRKMVQPGDPLNKVESIDSITAAPMVFGSVMGTVMGEKPTTKKELDEHFKTGGLGFVPKKYRNMFAQAGNKYGIAPRLLAYVAQHESGFDPSVTSAAGAQGMMQIMPSWGLENPFNARASINKGAQILAAYINSMGSVRLGLAAYNAGPSNFEAGLGYADAILDALRGRVA